MSRFSLRIRLAALIGTLLIISGAALLAISYRLVSSNLHGPPPPAASTPHNRNTPPSGGLGMTGTRTTVPGIPPAHTISLTAQAAQKRLADRALDRLVTQYLEVLAGIAVVAVGVGWLLAGRLLRSVRRVSAVARQVTGGNLAARVGLGGPRDELRELADTFDAMLARLDEMFSSQRRLIADASHELRTPLAVMRAEIEVLAENPAATARDIETATATLRRQLPRSEELMDALLALSRSEPELRVNAPVDLGKVARQVLEGIIPDPASRHLHLRQSIAPAIVDGDRRLLVGLVTNLVANAIKHNHDGGWIELRTEARDGKAVLIVDNSGPVLAPESVEGLARPFTRGGKARTGDGHGLGLTIAKAVAEAHNGELMMQPHPDGGLRVTASLPWPGLKTGRTFARSPRPPTHVSPSPSGHHT
jgi:signal transduction histidine kinase